MDIRKLRGAVDKLRDDLEDGLIATDIWLSADGQSIYGYNSQPMACVLFNQVTGFLSKTLKGSHFPPLGEYYLVALADGKMILVIPSEDYQWGMLIDTKKTPAGLFLNVVLPDAVARFKEALGR